MSCASAGIFSGYAYLNGRLDQLQTRLTTNKCKTVLGFSKQVWADRLIEKVATEIVSDEDVLEIDSFVSACRVPMLGESYFNLKEYSAKERAKLFEAGVAFPVLCRGPIEFEHKYYIDGGFLDNIPIYPLYGQHYDLMLILHTDPSYIPSQRIFQDAKVVIDIDTSAYVEKRASSFTVDSKSMLKKVDIGKEYGAMFAQKVLQGLDDLDIETLRKRAFDFMEDDAKRREKKRNLSLEGLATFVNEIYSDLVF